MDRLALKNIFRVAVASRDTEANDGELIDVADIHGNCSSECCAVTWKPLSSNKDMSEDADLN